MKPTVYLFLFMRQRRRSKNLVFFLDQAFRERRPPYTLSIAFLTALLRGEEGGEGAYPAQEDGQGGGREVRLRGQPLLVHICAHEHRLQAHVLQQPRCPCMRCSCSLQAEVVAAAHSVVGL